MELVANDVNAKIAVRTTTDNPSSSPTYTSFNDFANGTFKGRGFQFRITLDTADTAQNMNLQQAGYTATMPSRTEQSSVIASGAGAKAVTFTAPFFVGTSALGNLNSFYQLLIFLHRIWHQAIILNLVVYLELALQFTLKTQVMLVLIGTLPTVLLVLAKEVNMEKNSI